MIDILLKIKPLLEMGYTLSFIEAELLKRAIDQVNQQQSTAENSPVAVKLPETFYAVIQQGKVAMLPAKDGHWLNLTAVKEVIRAAGWEIAE